MRACSMRISSGRALDSRNAESGLGRLDFVAQHRHLHPLIVGLLLRDGLVAQQFLGPLPGDFGPLQFGLPRPAECRRLAALLRVGAVEEAFELGFGQRKFRRGQGRFPGGTADRPVGAEGRPALTTWPSSTGACVMRPANCGRSSISEVAPSIRPDAKTCEGSAGRSGRTTGALD